MSSKENSKKTLKFFSYLYLILAGISLIFGLIYLANPDIVKELVEVKYSYVDFKEFKPEIILFSSFLIECLVYLWQYWLLKRVATEKSKGTFVLVLLVVSIIGSIVSLFGTFDVPTLLGLLVDVYVLQLVYIIRN